jgi:hypothetical protein
MTMPGREWPSWNPGATDLHPLAEVNDSTASRIDTNSTTLSEWPTLNLETLSEKSFDEPAESMQGDVIDPEIGNDGHPKDSKPFWSWWVIILLILAILLIIVILYFVVSWWRSAPIPITTILDSLTDPKNSIEPK